MFVNPLGCKTKPAGVQVLSVTGVLAKCLSLMAFSLTLGHFFYCWGTVIAFRGNNEYFCIIGMQLYVLLNFIII